MDAYSICNEVVMYSDRVVILAALQKRVLKEFHVGHPGMSKMKSLVRSLIYRTNIDWNFGNTLEASKGYALAAKAPPIIHSSWPKSKGP